MLRPHFRTVSALGILAISTCFVACNDDAKDALKSELNKTDFNLVDPANDWTYAGGIAVYDTKNPKAGTVFYGLPPGVDKPQTTPATASWGADKISGTFTAQALVSGLGTVVKGGLSVNHSNQTTLAQINASGARLSNPEAILNNPAVATQIKSWLSSNRYSVYIVSTALTTSSLSATTSSSAGVSAAFGSSVQQCPASSGGTSSGGTTTRGTTGAGTTTGGTSTGGGAAPGSTGGGTSGGGPTTGGTAGGGATGTGAAGGGTGGTTAGGTSGPTANLQVCKNDDSSFTLTTQASLVFATLTNAVALQDGTLQLIPVAETVPGGGERGKEIPSQAAMLSGKWTRRSWPGP